MTPNDVSIVVENIDDFIEVPDGVVRLRKAVLTLAVSGKLVPQDKKEGTAEALYSLIQSERAKKTQLSKKKTKKFGPILSQDLPFDIPKSWKWVQVGDVCEVNPRNNLIDDLQVSFLPMVRVFSGWGKNPDTSENRMWKAVKTAFTHIAEDDVVLAKITPCFENEKSGIARGLLNGYAAGTTELHVFRANGLIEPEYLLMAFKTPFFVEKAKKNMTGTAGQKRVPTEYVASALLPLPPLTEQKRIVKKVEEVMKQLDDLEDKKQECDKTRTRLARSAMQSLGKGESKIAFEYFTELIKTPADLKELEDALLLLAVFGHLTSKVSEDSKIPQSWKWLEWGDVLSNEKYSMKRGPFGSALRKDFFVPDGIKVYEQYNAIHNVDRERYFITDEKYRELEAFTVRPGDLIISCSGTLGRIAELHSTSKIGIINQALLKIKLNHQVILNNYFILLFRSDFIQNRIYLEALGTAMTNMVNVKTLKKILLPIPPLSEQKNIIKKVEEVMSLIDKLRKYLPA